jgi:uncharacterized damage-inducible protein DinB
VQFYLTAVAFVRRGYNVAMTYYSAKELAAAFRTVRNNTVKIAEEIAEENYGFRATPETRTVAETLTHIGLSTGLAYQIHHVDKLTTLVGFDFPSFVVKSMAEAAKPRSRDQILTLLREEGERIASWLEGMSDEFLGERVSMPTGMTPDSKSRFEMLLSMKEHEMHHRGQLMLMQRMMGAVPHLTREMQARMSQMMAAKTSA